VAAKNKNGILAEIALLREKLSYQNADGHDALVTGAHADQ
jgi:hypothetical protein